MGPPSWASAAVSVSLVAVLKLVYVWAGASFGGVITGSSGVAPRVVTLMGVLSSSLEGVPWLALWVVEGCG